eukprot:2716280-Rhodomonas_salina.2
MSKAPLASSSHACGSPCGRREKKMKKEEKRERSQPGEDKSGLSAAQKRAVALWVCFGSAKEEEEDLRGRRRAVHHAEADLELAPAAASSTSDTRRAPPHPRTAPDAVARTPALHPPWAPA